MYWITKYNSTLEDIIKYTSIAILLAVSIYVLNGSKNDFVLVHHLSLYMALTCLEVVFIMIAFLIVIGIHDVTMFLVNRTKH